MFRFSLFIIAALIFSAGLCPPSPLWAGGRQANTQTAEGTENWQTEFDVSGLKPGKYNFIVTAKDSSGNTGTSGPFNVRLDPKSGLPSARVVYPENNAVIRNELKIIGTASGQYGVKRVLARLDDGEYTPVEGIEYWSQVLDPATLYEGRHTVYAKAIDSKDAEGPEFSTDFIVDKGPPLIGLVSHKTGDFISGTQTLSGIASDPNGIAFASWSADGQTWNRLPLKTKKDQTEARFSFLLRTKSLNDGPAVYYIRAVDKTGCTLTRPYLFFVNNQPPLLEIIAPAQDENVPGLTQITGSLSARMGLSKFFYEWNGTVTDIPLNPGDPFWTITLPALQGAKRGALFKITAVDNSGNVTSLTRRFQDKRRSKTPAPGYPELNSGPQIEFLTPPESYGAVHGMVTVCGLVRSAAPLAELAYSLDGTSFTALPYVSDNDKFWFSYTCDFTSLNGAGGRFTVRAADQAGASVQRNLDAAFDDSGDIPALILNSPLENEVITGDFSISGIAFDDDGINAVHWRILAPENPWDDIGVTAEKKKAVTFESISTARSFETSIGFNAVRDGENIIECFAEDIYGVRSKPERRIIRVSSAAPLIKVGGPSINDRCRGNIVISGVASDLNGVKDVFVSMDSGNSYQKADMPGGKNEWKLNLNTGIYKDGVYTALIRAVDSYGIEAFSSALININNEPSEVAHNDGEADTPPPLVVTSGPAENSSHRDSILIHGSTNAGFEAESVEVTLRPGDKAGYEAPQFIQGLYLDTGFLGGSAFTTGLGLSFFENNVKIQFQYGYAPGGGRYSGHVIGTKLIANVLRLPFDRFFGSDWGFLSTSLGIGANFSWYTMEAGETPLMMSGVFAQWEFVRADLGHFFPEWKYFKTLSFYIEPVVWFAPSDVSGGEAARAIFRFSLGTRLSLF